MSNLTFSTGLKEFSLNNAVTVFFNPLDQNFIAEVFEVFESLEEEQEKMQESVKGSDARTALNAMKEADKNMRERINGLFGQDICTPCFGSMSTYAVADGMPVWANLMLAVMDTMEGNAAEQAKVQKERIRKYTAKYTTSDHKKKGQS